VSHAGENAVAATDQSGVVEHEIEWEPGDVDVDEEAAPAYELGPAPESLVTNPYYLSSPLNDLN
jgi:hypothetical protein